MRSILTFMNSAPHPCRGAQPSRTTLKINRFLFVYGKVGTVKPATGFNAVAGRLTGI
ncbi:MAG: hypothetical protein ACI92A_001622 [Candidatus Paceibacteria bacterium]